MGLKRYFIARDGMECFAKIERLYGALQYAINGDSGFTILDEELIKREKSIRCNLFAFIANPDGDWRNPDVGLCGIHRANGYLGIRNALWIEYNRVSKACKRRLPYWGGISRCVNGVGVCYHSACTGNIWDNLVKRSWITIYFAALKII